jgi:hypothetical protein
MTRVGEFILFREDRFFDGANSSFEFVKLKVSEAEPTSNNTCSNHLVLTMPEVLKII